MALEDPMKSQVHKINQHISQSNLITLKLPLQLRIAKTISNDNFTITMHLTI